MNIYKVKKIFLTSIKFKTKTTERTQKGDWVSKLWSVAHWNIQKSNVRLKIYEKIHNILLYL